MQINLIGSGDVRVPSKGIFLETCLLLVWCVCVHMHMGWRQTSWRWSEQKVGPPSLTEIWALWLYLLKNCSLKCSLEHYHHITHRNYPVAVTEISEHSSIRTDWEKTGLLNASHGGAMLFRMASRFYNSLQIMFIDVLPMLCLQKNTGPATLIYAHILSGTYMFRPLWPSYSQ